MPTLLRLAVPESLRAAAERAAAPAWRVVTAPPPGDARQRLRWQRLWQERRCAGGGGLAAAEAALADGSVRALLLLLDHQADAALLPEADDDGAWGVLEPLPGGTCADLWVGELGGPFGWVDWNGDGEVSLAAERLRAAASALGRRHPQGAVAALISFAGGRDPFRAAARRLADTLQAREPARILSLYSPLFYPDGQLNAAALLRTIRAAGPAAPTPVLCVPRLARAEFAAAVIAAGGCWAGPCRAGAEAPVARLAPDATPETVAATLAWLAEGVRRSE